MKESEYRKTTQYLIPLSPIHTEMGAYNPYPFHPLPSGKIEAGFDAVAEKIIDEKTVVIDGFPGVLWGHFRTKLDAILQTRKVGVRWTAIETALQPSPFIDRLIEPYLGGDDPLFGYRFPGKLVDFYDMEKLSRLVPDPSADINILIGTGASLAGWEGMLIYVDVPKNEIQFRSRAFSIKNIGADQPLDPIVAYKRSYFIDWAAANQHKAELLPRIDWYIDEQHPETPTIMDGETLREYLSVLAKTHFRVRPWFEPGPWGGQWIKKKIPLLAQEVPNYAWSFELIVPENGLVFESDGALLEVSFDLLMYQEYQNVLGDSARNFKYEFPIRYDFLDTIEGGNLSIQCHPRPEYIRTHFGERFTQDECYYILDCVPGARVNLGFQENIKPELFKETLIESAQTGQAVEIEQYVQSNPVRKHDFLLIPGGTIHGAGIGNLVLEISATTYIFTFKMYDWLRMGLDGKPRTLNIERAFDNLCFDRRGSRIRTEFISHPQLIDEGKDWQIFYLPTHINHFYDVHRIEFCGTVHQETRGSCNVLSLVEGSSVLLKTANGGLARYNYAETFVVPAGAESYSLTSEDGSLIKVIKTFIKPADQWVKGVVPDAED